MMMKPIERLSRSKKGQMPFAMIAVALLLTGAAYGVICANVQDAEDETEDLADQFQAMDDAVEDNKERIESGLGRIICDLSSSEYGGSLIQRMDSFDVLRDEWLSENYPYCNRGVTATVTSYDLDIKVESMKLSSGEIVADSTQASFFRCEGTVSIHLVNSTGESDADLEIVSDGTSCLPFIAGSSSEFELSAAGGSSILTQLMTYQLSALAQSRIVNGYGALSVTGYHGVNSIITESDVNEAFRNSLSIVETMCFRDNGEDFMELTASLNVDAAEMIVLNNGYFEIDMSAIVAQVLSSMFDDMFGKWVDFIFGDSFLQIADELADDVRKVMYSIVEFCKNVPGLKQIYDIAASVFNYFDRAFGGSDEETDSAVRYIRDAMEDAGYSEDDYRYIEYSIDYHFDGYDIEGSNRTYHYDALDFTVDFDTDIFDWDGWSGYVTDYMDNTNAIAETIKNILNTIFAEIAGDYGVYRIAADEFDSEDFLTTYKEALQTAVSKGLAGSDYYINSSLGTNVVCDPFYASIYLMMEDHQDEIFKWEDKAEVIRALRGNYDWIQSLMILGYAPIFCDLCEPISSTDSLSEEFETAVSEHLALFKSVLNNVVNHKADALKTVIIAAGKKVLDTGLISSKVEDFCYGLVEDTIDNISLSTSSGIQKLDGLGSYRLYDYDGNIREEFVDVKDRYDLDVTITTPVDNASKNVHTVNPEELTYMPFTSVFTVRVSTVLGYTVTSASSVDLALNRNDAAISGTFVIDTAFDIACVSGWELAGASYTPSTNIIDYLWEKLMEFLRPLIDPLSSIFESIRDVYNILSSSILEMQERLNAVINLIYEAIAEAIDSVQNLIESCVMDLLIDVIEEFDIGLGKESVTLNIFGFLVKVEFYVSTYMSKTMKHIVKVSIEGMIGDVECSAFIDIKQNAKKEVFIKGGAGIDTDDFCIDVSIDPLLKFGKRIVSAEGTVRDINFDIALPERVLYDEVELRLSDIPAVGQMLDNIVLPIPGVKAGIDAGVELKFNLPIGTGLMINEFESNPKGNDSGAEWVELYNATAKTIDLEGYAIVPKSNEDKALMLSGSIAPFEHKVFYFSGQSLINDRSGKCNGESLTLYDPAGAVVDKTPAKKDTYNDERTWQRKSDGDSTWVFNKATEGTSNGSRFNVNSIVKTFFIDTLISSAQQAFCDMGNHLTSVDEIIEFLQHLLRLYIEKIIDKIANMLIGASVFIEIELQDSTGSVHTGFRLAFEIGSDLIEEGLHWLLSQIPFLGDFVKRPSSSDPIQIICENSYFTLSYYASAGAPSFLKIDGAEFTYVTRVGANICCLTELFGKDTGEWKLYAGIMIEDIDPKILPAGLRSNQSKSCDLWLIKMEISE